MRRVRIDLVQSLESPSLGHEKGHRPNPYTLLYACSAVSYRPPKLLGPVVSALPEALRWLKLAAGIQLEEPIADRVCPFLAAHSQVKVKGQRFADHHRRVPQSGVVGVLARQRRRRCMGGGESGHGFDLSFAWGRGWCGRHSRREGRVLELRWCAGETDGEQPRERAEAYKHVCFG